MANRFLLTGTEDGVLNAGAPPQELKASQCTVLHPMTVIPIAYRPLYFVDFVTIEAYRLPPHGFMEEGLVELSQTSGGDSQHADPVGAEAFLPLIQKDKQVSSPLILITACPVLPAIDGYVRHSIVLSLRHSASHTWLKTATAILPQAAFARLQSCHSAARSLYSERFDSSRS